MGREIRIEDYSHSYNLALKGLENSKLVSEHNKDLIKRFDLHIARDGSSGKARRTKVLRMLKIFFEKHAVKKDADKFTIEDVEKSLDTMAEYSKSANTITDYRRIFRMFLRYIHLKQHYKNKLKSCEIADWIPTTLKKRDLSRLKTSELLTEEEVVRMINATTNARNRAFISILYELGARIGEIGGLAIGDLTPNEYGYLINLEGKTDRKAHLQIINSSNAIRQWLQIHPFKNDNSAPLWVDLKHPKKEPIKRAGLTRILQKASWDAGVTEYDKAKYNRNSKAGNPTRKLHRIGGKRIYPHLFRHSRVTHVLNSGEMTETQAKVYFGWTPSTRQLETYSHLTQKDVNEARLKHAGIINISKIDGMKVKICPNCSQTNDPSEILCNYCNKPLGVKEYQEIKRKQEKDAISTIEKIMPQIQELINQKVAEELEKRKKVKA